MVAPYLPAAATVSVTPDCFCTYASTCVCPVRVAAQEAVGAASDGSPRVALTSSVPRVSPPTAVVTATRKAVVCVFWNCAPMLVGTNHVVDDTPAASSCVAVGVVLSPM